MVLGLLLVDAFARLYRSAVAKQSGPMGGLIPPPTASTTTSTLASTTNATTSPTLYTGPCLVATLDIDLLQQHSSMTKLLLAGRRELLDRLENVTTTLTHPQHGSLTALGVSIPPPGADGSPLPAYPPLSGAVNVTCVSLDIGSDGTVRGAESVVTPVSVSRAYRIATFGQRLSQWWGEALSAESNSGESSSGGGLQPGSGSSGYVPPLLASSVAGLGSVTEIFRCAASTCTLTLMDVRASSTAAAPAGGAGSRPGFASGLWAPHSLTTSGGSVHDPSGYAALPDLLATLLDGGADAGGENQNGGASASAAGEGASDVDGCGASPWDAVADGVCSSKLAAAAGLCEVIRSLSTANAAAESRGGGLPRLSHPRAYPRPPTAFSLRRVPRLPLVIATHAAGSLLEFGVFIGAVLLAVRARGVLAQSRLRLDPKTGAPLVQAPGTRKAAAAAASSSSSSSSSAVPLADARPPTRGEYEDVVRAVLVSSFARTFVVVAAVWNYTPAVLLSVIGVFCFTSQITALKAVLDCKWVDAGVVASAGAAAALVLRLALWGAGLQESLWLL